MTEMFHLTVEAWREGSVTASALSEPAVCNSSVLNTLVHTCVWTVEPLNINHCDT